MVWWPRKFKNNKEAKRTMEMENISKALASEKELEYERGASNAGILV